jgi:phosphatidylserine/phosphatidylglycerophosphate/cardiolipin synthase-like enzyme
MAAITRPADRIVTTLEERRSAVLEVIRGAKRSLVLSLFRCNDDEIFEELGRATARGVAVEALITSRAKGGKKKLQKLWDRLARTGASVYAYTEPVVKYHAKYLVADDGPAVVASLNLTRKCFERTCDALVVTWDAAVVDGLRRLLDADRERRPLPDAVPARLIVGPERARRQFDALIRQAKTSIRLIDAKMSDPDMLALLAERRALGLTVEVFGSKCVAGLKSHGKMLLIDDRVAVVGSLALAAISLDFRREVAIVVEEARAVEEIGRLMDDIRAAESDDAARVSC